MYEWYGLFRINDNAMILRQSKHFRNFFILIWEKQHIEYALNGNP